MAYSVTTFRINNENYIFYTYTLGVHTTDHQAAHTNKNNGTISNVMYLDGHQILRFIC